MNKSLSAFFLAIAFSASVCAAADDAALYAQSGAKPAPWDSIVKQGISFYDQGVSSQDPAVREENLEKARKLLRESYDLGCRDGIVLYDIGYIYYERGENQKAYKYSKEAQEQLSKQYPDHEYNNDVLFTIAYSTPDAKEAVEYYKRRLAVAPDDINSKLNLAYRYIDLNDATNATTVLQDVNDNCIASLDDYGKATMHFAFGKAAFIRGDFAAAEKHFTESYGLRKDISDYLWLAFSYEKMSKIPDARAIYDNIAQEAPRGSYWYVEARKHLEKLGQ